MTNDITAQNLIGKIGHSQSQNITMLQRLADVDGDNVVSRAEANQIIRQFDTNYDKAVSSQEIKDTFNAPDFKTISKKDVIGSFINVDFGDATSKQNNINTLQKLADKDNGKHGVTEYEANQLFAKYDVNDDKKINKPEMKKIIFDYFLQSSKDFFKQPTETTPEKDPLTEASNKIREQNARKNSLNDRFGDEKTTPQDYNAPSQNPAEFNITKAEIIGHFKKLIGFVTFRNKNIYALQRMADKDNGKYGVTKYEANQFFAKTDLDNNGDISKAEFNTAKNSIK